MRCLKFVCCRQRTRQPRLRYIPSYAGSIGFSVNTKSSDITTATFTQIFQTSFAQIPAVAFSTPSLIQPSSLLTSTRPRSLSGQSKPKMSVRTDSLLHSNISLVLGLRCKSDIGPVPDPTLLLELLQRVKHF